MSNFNSKFLILILTVTLLPIALSEPEAIKALVKRLDSKRPSSSVQEAAAKAVLKRLLPGYVSSFKFKIVSNVMWFFFLTFFIMLNFEVDPFCCLITALFQLGALQLLYSCMLLYAFMLWLRKDGKRKEFEMWMIFHAVFGSQRWEFWRKLGEIVLLSCSWLIIFQSDSHVRFDCCFSPSGSVGFRFNALVKVVSFGPSFF